MTSGAYKAIGGRVLQHPANLVLPWIGWLAGKAGRPLALVEVAKTVARRHNEPVIQQPLHPVRRRIVAVNSNPAAQGSSANATKGVSGLISSLVSLMTNFPSLQNFTNWPAIIVGAISST